MEEITSYTEQVSKTCFTESNKPIDCWTGKPIAPKPKREICKDKDFQKIYCDTGELAKEIDDDEPLGRVEAHFNDCEFSMESPGMILMYGATMVLVVVAIFGIYIAKRKT